jgi:dihydrofolate reductase
MRKIIFLMHMSLDGYVAGSNGEMDWITYDSEVAQYSHDLHSVTDAAIYGRVTYQMMEGYWPTVLTNPNADAGEMSHARWLDDATKVVVSRTLDNVTWKGTVVIRDNVAEEINKMKQQQGKDMWLLGSPTLTQTLIQANLIDEYRLNVNPVVLGRGKSLFANSDQQHKLALIEARQFKCGVVGLRYAKGDKS